MRKMEDKMSKMKQVKTYEPYAGTLIEEAIAEGIAIAKEKDCYVRFNFNGIQMECCSFNTIEGLVDFYHQQIEKKKKVRKIRMSWGITIDSRDCPFLLNGHECRYVKKGESDKEVKECNKKRCPIKNIKLTLKDWKEH